MVKNDFEKTKNLGVDFEISQSKRIDGLCVFKPSISYDERGFIWTSYLKKEIEKFLPNNLFFKHDKFSYNKKNVLRGIHGDYKSWKLVTCIYGSIQQVVVDCRKDSKTINNYEIFFINEKNIISVLIPPGLGNAFYVKSENAVYHYKLAYDGNYTGPEKQFTYKWNDPVFNIAWDTQNPILSDRDK